MQTTDMNLGNVQPLGEWGMGYSLVSKKMGPNGRLLIPFQILRFFDFITNRITDIQNYQGGLRNAATTEGF